MMNSIIQNKHVRNIIKAIFQIAFCLTVWQIFSVIVNHSYFLPDVPTTLKALFVLVTSSNFFGVIFETIIRVITGLFLGVILGIFFAIICHKSKIANMLISPIISIIKATPVASFIIILWISVSGKSLPVIIAFLMVLPIIFQNIIDGYNSIPKELEEICTVYEFSALKKFKVLTFPCLIKYLIPAVITATGLAWKSEIAAEIIAYTKDSIGYYIHDANYYSDTATVFAWTIVIIVLSIILEKASKALLRRFKQ